jgi:hypothetical protein
MELSVSEVEVLALLGCSAAYGCSFSTDVSGQLIGSNFKGQTVQEILGLPTLSG